MRESETLSSTGKNPSSVEVESARPATLTSIRAGFELSSVRCDVEGRLDERIRGDEDLLQRIRRTAEDLQDRRVQGRLELVTDAYRVDEAITPKLYRLGTVLARALRLVQPLVRLLHFRWPRPPRFLGVVGFFETLVLRGPRSKPVAGR